MRNRGNYRGVNRGGHRGRGGSRYHKKYPRDDDRDDERDDDLPVTAPLGNFKITFGGGAKEDEHDRKIASGSDGALPSVHSRLGKTRIRSSDEDEEESLSSRLVQPPSTSPERKTKSTRIVTKGPAPPMIEREEKTNGHKEKKEDSEPKLKDKDSSTTRVSRSVRRKSPDRQRSPQRTSRRKSPSPVKRRKSPPPVPHVDSPKPRKESPKPRKDSRDRPSTRKVSANKCEQQREPSPVALTLPSSEDKKEAKPRFAIANPKLTLIDVDELLEINFDFFKHLKKIVNERDRLGRTPLMIILDYTAVKSNIRSFEEKDFKNIITAVRSLVHSGADLAIKDIFGDTLLQYLARWRFGKEISKSRSDQLLPRRMREILKELPLKETGRESALSITELLDEGGRAFYHNIFWSNFRDQSHDENPRLANAIEIIVGSMKLPDSHWDLEDGEGNTFADTLLESELLSKAAYRALKEKCGNVELKAVKRAPDRFGENPFKPKKTQSPPRRERRSRQRSTSPSRRRRSSEAEPERSPEPAKKNKSRMDYYSDNEHVDAVDLHANADDFIEDVIQMMPRKRSRPDSRRSLTPKRRRSRSTSRRRSKDTRMSDRKHISPRRTRRSSTPKRISPARRRYSPDRRHRSPPRGSPPRRQSPDRRQRPSSLERRRESRMEKSQRHGTPPKILDTRNRRSAKTPDRPRRDIRRSRSNSRPRNFERLARGGSPAIVDHRRNDSRGKTPDRASRHSKEDLMRLANY